MRKLICLFPLALGLAACSTENEPEKGTSVSIDATGEDGEKVEIKADGETGKVAVKIPGFDANMRLPKAMLDDTNFDIDGVKLYPGSSVASVNINAVDTAAKGDRANVRISFNSPAEPAKVASWFKEQFDKQSIKIGGDADTLTGRSNNGDAFTIELAAADGGKTAGTVRISE